jgi:hypothetical protein
VASVRSMVSKSASRLTSTSFTTSRRGSRRVQFPAPGSTR